MSHGPFPSVLSMWGSDRRGERNRGATTWGVRVRQHVCVCVGGGVVSGGRELDGLCIGVGKTFRLPQSLYLKIKRSVDEPTFYKTSNINEKFVN